MSDVMADMDRAAAYWLKVARQGGDPAMAMQRAQRLLSEARAESRIPDRAHSLTLDDVEAPPLRPRM